MYCVVKSTSCWRGEERAEFNRFYEEIQYTQVNPLVFCFLKGVIVV